MEPPLWVTTGSEILRFDFSVDIGVFEGVFPKDVSCFFVICDGFWGVAVPTPSNDRLDLSLGLDEARPIAGEEGESI